MAHNEYAFYEIKIPSRASKPREKGITEVVDGLEAGSLGIRHAEDLMEVASEYIDTVKLNLATPRVQKRNFIKKKIDVYRSYNVNVKPGGIFLELAAMQGKVEAFLKEAKDLGFNVIEVSSNVITLSLEQKAALINLARSYGFKVIAEVGKKMTEVHLKPSIIINEIKNLLEVGAWKVAIESEEIEKTLFLKQKEKRVDPYILVEIAESVGTEKIIFEVPYGLSQIKLRPIFWWFVNQFGSDVNLANIEPTHVIVLELVRRGLSPHAFGKIPPL